MNIFRKSVEKIHFHYNLIRIARTLHEDQYKFLVMSGTFLLRMRNVSDKSCRENQNTHFIFNNFFFLENSPVYVTIWENIVEPDRPQMTIWRTHIACWTTKATHTRSECVILIPFPTATMVERTRLDFTLYVLCLSCGIDTINCTY
jgi:hypothetical protein